MLRGGDFPACRNLFTSLLGKPEAEVEAKIDGAWRQLFRGDEATQRLFYPVGDDMAYVPDIANNDVRTEGLSYGMMISVEMDRHEDFDRIWKWTKVHLWHPDGPARGYFSWHADLQGRVLDPGPASDGEEWFVTALFFASHRWGNGAGLRDYGAEAQGLLWTMLHKSQENGRGDYVDMIGPEAQEVVFVPHGEGASFTDPSYHLPAFYELWARWADSPDDRAFLRLVAAKSRKLFQSAANPVTGLMPDYCEFDGTPHARRGHEDFRFDAWRTLSNPAVDYAWNAIDASEAEQSNRVLRFLASPAAQGHDRFKLEGTPVGDDPHSPGLLAMAATAGQAADPKWAKPFVQALWDMGVPSGRYRYYNGLLYMIALLEDGGRFRAFLPKEAP
jgi:oligosaccharide reducing-end xylanase